MAEFPPDPDSQEPAPPDLSGYYLRPGLGFGGDPDRLKVLAEGYFGLNYVFMANVLLAVGARGLQLGVNPSEALTAVLIAVVVLFVLIAVLTYPFNRKIGIGMGWNPGMAALASILMGLNSAFCCGIVGYVVMQAIASTEMKKFGLKGGVFGMKKKDVERRIAELRSTSTTPGFQA
jgi:hypothetical protein